MEGFSACCKLSPALWAKSCLTLVLLLLCSAFSSPLVYAIDTDGDGYDNSVDLDDDNDGILDAVENNHYGSGSLADPFTSIKGANSAPAGRYYFNLGNGLFKADVDSSEGGGWVLILQYVHRGGTNPNLSVLGAGASLPELSSAALGADESGNAAAWGHAGNAAVNALDAEELRFYGITSNTVGRTGQTSPGIMHFSTPEGIDYAASGGGNFAGINTAHTALTGHTAGLPGSVANYYSNQGNYALTNFPFWLWGRRHWGIRGNGNRWEVDDFPYNFQFHTIHRIWARDTTVVGKDTDSDGIIDSLDTDSDGDGCPDALEASSGLINTALDANSFLTGGVDANGVPNVVGASGHSAGSALDKTVSVCPTAANSLVVIDATSHFTTETAWLKAGISDLNGNAVKDGWVLNNFFALDNATGTLNTTTCTVSGGSCLATITHNVGGVVSVVSAKIDGSAVKGSTVQTRWVMPPQPVFAIEKTVAVVSDPVNGTNNPKSLPGSEHVYAIQISNSANGKADANTIKISDTLISKFDFFTGDLDGAGSPIIFTDGVPSCELGFNFIDFASTTDDIDFYDASDNVINVIAPDGNGYDNTIRRFEIKPSGQFAAKTGANDPSCTFRFKVRLN